MKRISFFLVALLALTTTLTTLTALTATAATAAAAATTGNCPAAAESPAFLQTKEAWYGLHDSYTLIVNAMMYKGVTKEQTIAAAKWQLSRVDLLNKQAKALLDDDVQFLRRQWYKVKLYKIAVQATAAKVILKIGIPTFPSLGKFLLKTHALWDDLKKKLKKFFTGRKSEDESDGADDDGDDGGDDGGSVDDDRVDNDESDDERAQEDLKQELNDSFKEIGDSINDLKTKTFC